MRCEWLDDPIGGGSQGLGGVGLDNIGPTELGQATGMAWSRQGLQLAGLGEAARISFERPDGGTKAQESLAALAGPTSDAFPASGALAFAALPFDRTAPGELIVPTVALGAIGDAGGQRRWIIHDDSVSTSTAVDMIRQAMADPPLSVAGPQPSSWQLRSAVAPEHWRDHIVAPTRDRIAQGEFRKVVLARELLVTSDQPIDVRSVIKRLQQRQSAAMIFAVDGFIGATPELLVGRAGDDVRAHPLAGTAPRSSNPERDRELADELVGSTKNQTEHLITINWLLDNLLPYCSYVDAEPEPSIVTLPNVHHLGTRVEGRLSAPAASVLDLVAALHPTPALGGDPQTEALATIAAVEPGDRGRYGGPVGWVDASGNGEFAVGIRSATISGATASVWAGVGVIADSDEHAELAETRTKLEAMLAALVTP